MCFRTRLYEGQAKFTSMSKLTIPETVMTIGGRVRWLRKHRGHKQAALAALVGITQGTLSLIETDKTAIPAGDTVAALCRALRTTPDFLIAGGGDPESIQSAIDEHELVFLWRGLPEAGRQMVIDTAKSAQRALAPDSLPKP